MEIKTIIEDSKYQIKSPEQEIDYTKHTYIFYQQSNFNHHNKDQIQIWDEFDLANQSYLNLKYEIYKKDSNDYCFTLLYPFNNYDIDFKKMHQIHRIDTCKIIPIKLELIEKNILIDNQYSEEDFLFFWKANNDPWDQKEKTVWAPYDEEDQYILTEAYKNFIADKFKEKVDLKKPADHFIDFSKMLQINKYDSDKQRPVQRSHPKLVTNIVRKNRFFTSHNKSKIKPEIIEQKILNKCNLKSFFKSSNEATKKINKIYFNVFREFLCELEIEEQLCFFEDGTSIQVSLQEIKSILIQEISNLAKNAGDLSMTNTDNKYKSQIEQIYDYKSFFEKMVFIYTMEGYLYKNLNFFLRNLNKSGFENIKYYYTCLLSSFQYFSKNTQFNFNEDLVVYRASGYSEEEFQAYKAKNNQNIIRIFKEFLSTTIDYQTAMYFFNQDDNNSLTKKFIWEIRIPKEIVKNEAYNFADISKFSIFTNEKEILIRSGAIIQIDQITPYTEKIGNEIIKFKNKFKKICTLRSFSYASFLKLISLDSSVIELDLSYNDLSSNDKKMLYLNEALEKNNSIQTLNLRENFLGANEKDMLYLKGALQKNNSILFLDLRGNSLGNFEVNMLYLKEALENNYSIKELNLSLNNLGSNDKNMLYLKEALEINKSIKKLDIQNNGLGLNDKNMEYLKEALEKNKSILKLYLGYNNLGANEKNMLYLKIAFEHNNKIKNLDLSSNYLGENYMDILYLKEALEKNKSIIILNLSYNSLGSNEKNILYLKEALEKNNSLKKINLDENQLGSNEKILISIMNKKQNNKTCIIF